MSSMWLSNLPSNWKANRLKNIVTLSTSRVNERSADDRYIGLENIESWTGRLLDSAVAINKEISETGTNSTANQFEAGDILFGKLRPYLAKAHLAKESGICTTELLVMKPKPEIDGQFLLDVILTPEFITQVNAETFGARMPRADWDIISNIYVPLPPLAEQGAIANYLDHTTATIDALITAKQRLLDLLAEKRRALITHAVTRGLDATVPLRDSEVEWLGEIPAHWDIPPVYTRFEVQLGKMLDEKRIRSTHLAPYVRNVDVQWGYVNTENLQEMDFDEVDRLKYALRSGDILVCEGGEIGRTVIWNGERNDCYFQKAIIRLRPVTQKDIPEFFVYVMYMMVQMQIFTLQATNATIQHLPAETLRRMRYAAPPLPEQRVIVNYLDQKIGKLNDLILTTNTTIKLLYERRTALIEAAVIGKLNLE